MFGFGIFVFCFKCLVVVCVFSVVCDCFLVGLMVCWFEFAA